MQPIQLRTFADNYVFDDRLADCDKCGLQSQRAKTMCLAQRPREFNGLMIVGEGPGANEARLKTPFIGRAGQLVDRFLQLVGLERSQTHITNATLCMPDPVQRAAAQVGKKKQGQGKLTVDYPTCVPSCAPRLFTEIEVMRPRVILALGDAALHALLGGFQDVTVKRAITCEVCLGRTTLPWWKCTVKGCGKPNLLQPFTTSDAVVAGIPCQGCGWEPTPELGILPQKTRKKCPGCDGRKTLKTVEQHWLCDHTISFVAGGTFRAQELGYPEGVEYIIPTYHPSYLQRKNETKGDKQTGGQFLAAAALEHWKKAARLLVEDSTWHSAHRLIRTAEEFWAYVNELSPHDRWTSIDIETDAKEEFDVTRIRCFGLHHETHPEAGVCITEETLLDGSKRALHRDHPLIQAICQWLLDKRYEKTLQNGTYDTQTIWSMWGLEVEGWTRDTLLAHNTVSPDEPHDLSHIVFTYTDAPPWKPPKNQGGIEKFESDEQLYEYNGRDCIGTTHAMIHLEREMAKEGTEFVHQIDIAKTHVARGMNRAGMPVDIEMWNERRNEVAKREHDALAAARALIGVEDFNPNSHPQLSWALYDPHGPCKLVPSRFTDETMKTPSTDAVALAKHHEHPFVKHILDYREFSKLHGTYFGRIDPVTNKQVKGIVIQENLRLYCDWNPRGARTGRWTSSPNFQNWPKELRNVVLAPPGRKLVGADLEQAELRAIGALSGDKMMIAKCMNADGNRKLEPEWDPHSYIASIAFPHFVNIPLDTKEGKELRKMLREVAKTVVYAMNYGAGAEKIWQGIYDKGYNGPPLTVLMVKAVMDAYYRGFPDVRVYANNAVMQAKQTGYVRDAIIGRLRCFPLGEVDETIAKNYAIQATVASIMDMSILEFATHLPKVDPTAMIIAQVHDAVYAEVDENRAEAVSDLLTECMSQDLQLVPGAPFMSFPAVGTVGDRWDQV